MLIFSFRPWPPEFSAAQAFLLPTLAVALVYEHGKYVPLWLPDLGMAGAFIVHALWVWGIPGPVALLCAIVATIPCSMPDPPPADSPVHPWEGLSQSTSDRFRIVASLSRTGVTLRSRHVTTLPENILERLRLFEYPGRLGYYPRLVT